MQQQDNRENYSVGLHKLRSAPKVIGMIKSREMRCDMYGDTGNAYRVLVRKLEGRRPLASLDVDVRTALKLITNTLDVMAWAGSIRINIERTDGPLRRWQENSGSIQCVDRMHWTGNCLLAIQFYTNYCT